MKLMKIYLVLLAIVLMAGSAFATCNFEADTLYFPNGGEDLSETVTITWDPTVCDGAEKVDVYYSSTGCGGPVTIIDTCNVGAAIGTCSWTTDSGGNAVADGNNYCLKVEDVAKTNNDWSDAVFTIDNIDPVLNAGDIIGTTIEEGEDTINITFSEDMKEAFVEDYNNWVIESPDGSGPLTLTNANFVYDSGTYTLTITLDESEAGDNEYLRNEFDVCVTPLNLEDLAGNLLSNAEVCSTTDVTGDINNPEVLNIIATPNPAKDGLVTIEVEFNEDLSAMPDVEVIGLTSSPYKVIETGFDRATNTWTGTFAIIDNDEETTGTVTVVGAVDLAGNDQDVVGVGDTFEVDTIDPLMTIINPLDNEVIKNANKEVEFTFNATDTNRHLCYYSIDGEAQIQFTDCTSPQPVQVVEDGWHDITLIVTDTAGNSEEDTVHVLVDSDKTLHVPADYATIQEAINAATDNDTIEVFAGTYTENLTINKELTINGEDAETTFIVGTHVILKHNTDLTNLNFDPKGGVAITIDTFTHQIDYINIENCTFNLTFELVGAIPTGINIGTLCSHKVSTVNINNNIFNGPESNKSFPFMKADVFGVNDCEVENIFFKNNEVNSGSILLNLRDSNLTGIEIENNVFRSTRGTVGIVAITDSSPTGNLSKFKYTNNDLDSSNGYGVAFFDGVLVGSDLIVGPAGTTLTDDNFGTGNRIENNRFVGILGGSPGGIEFVTVTMRANLETYEIDATENWWGYDDGPYVDGNYDGQVSANVLYDQWCKVEDCSELTSGVNPSTSDNVPEGWQTSDVTVTLTCNDGITGSGCSKVYYTIDGTNPTGASDYVDVSDSWNFTISDDGEYPIKYMGEDNAGNVEAIQTAINTLQLDKTNPAIDIDNDASTVWVNSDTITVDVDDATSLIYETRYIISENEICDATKSELLDEGTNGTEVIADDEEIYYNKYICFRTTDNAGWTAYTVSSKLEFLDTSAPDVDVGEDVNTNAQFPKDAEVTNSEESGVDSYNWTRVSGPGLITFGTANAEDTTISADTDGTYVIRLTVIDNAGNSNFDEFTLVWDQTSSESEGPDVSPNPVIIGAFATFTGVVTDAIEIKDAKLYVKNSTNDVIYTEHMTPSDGVFDSTIETVELIVDGEITTGWEKGTYSFWISGQDIGGNWQEQNADNTDTFTVTDLGDYYTRDQVDEKFEELSPYYNTTDIDNILTNYYTMTESDDNYYSKEAVNGLIAGLSATHYNTTQINLMFANYYNATNIDLMFAFRIIASSPSGVIGDDEPDLEVSTTQNAVCKYHTSAFDFSEEGILMDGSDTTEHSVGLGTLPDETYFYYVVCQDTNTGVLTDYFPATFKVDTTGNFEYTQYLNNNWNALWLPNPLIIFGSTENGYWGYDIELTLEDLFDDSGLENNYEIVWYYDSTIPEWTAFNNDGNSTNDDLVTVNNRNDQPYWIKMDSADRFEVNENAVE